MGVCAHWVCGGGLCAPGYVCRCGSVTVSDPRSGFVLGLLGVYTRVIQMYAICIVYTSAVCGSVWGICSCFGELYTCAEMAF